MNFSGLLIGAVAFVSIGVFHPIVIKAEYYFSKSCWPVFLVFGAVLVGASLLLNDHILSAAAAVVGMSCWWSILELFHQEKRVQRGWFPENPNRKKR